MAVGAGPDRFAVTRADTHEGQEIYRTAAVEAILAEASARKRVLDAARRVVHERLDSVGPGCAVGAMPVSLDGKTRKIRTAGACYSIRVASVEAPASDAVAVDQPLALVAVERRAPILPSARRLRERFALTPREAEVALMLAQRRPNAEIAEMLCISACTVRHHAERVLEKLDIRRRTEVVRVLEEMD